MSVYLIHTVEMVQCIFFFTSDYLISVLFLTFVSLDLYLKNLISFFFLLYAFVYHLCSDS